MLILGALLLEASFAPAASADPASPLVVTNAANPSPVVSGDQLTYTISIENSGGAKVTNVVMTDQVNGVGTIQQPPGLPQLTITATKGSCTQGGANGNVVTCQIGDLDGRGTATVTIRGQVTAADGTTLNNTASVSATKSAQNFTTNASVSVLVQGGTGGGTDLPDLTLNKTGPTDVTVGDPMDYTLTVNNVGTANTADVRVVDTLPAGVTLQGDPFSTTSLFECTPSGTDPITVTCDGGTVNAGQNATIAIHAVAPDTAGTITNTAIVDPDNAIDESDELNNASATVNTSVAELPPPTPQLTIVKTDNNPDQYPWSSGAGPDPVNPGDQLTYKILVTNEADTRADDVVMTDGTQGLDAGSIVASQVVSNGRLAKTDGCVVSAPRVRCSVRALDSGGTIAITITGTVVGAAGSTIFNTATVTGNIKNTGVSATDSESTTIRPDVDLTITKAGNKNPVCARSWPDGGHLASPPDGLTAAGGTTPALLAPPVCQDGLRYDFVVGNSGNGLATNVTVRDPLPAGTIFDSYSTNGGFACSVASGVVTCSGGSVPAASTRTISFLVVPPATTGTITNTVTVDPNNAIFEPDETNNTATATTDIVTGVDLVAWKSDSVDAASPGAAEPVLTSGTATSLGDGYDPIATRGTETYTVYVDNVGTQDTTGIKVVDTLPADTIFLSVVADTTHGFTCSHNGATSGGVVTCVGGHLLGTEAEFYDPAGTMPAGPGDDFATIKIRVFARSTVGTMHNEVRVDPDNTIAEHNELNNTATDDTDVVTGNADQGSYVQLKVTKTQIDPSPNAVPPDPDATVATNGTLIYNLHVENLGTDPVSSIVVKDFLPSGSRFISASDADTGPGTADAFFCTHDNAPTGGTITCTGGALSGSINTIPENAPGNPPPAVPTARDIVVKIFAPNTPGSILNLAKVDPDNAIAEGNEFDNSSSIATTVTVGGNNMFNELNLTKTQTDPVTTCGIPVLPCVATSSVVEYTLAVKNDGSDPAFQVLVRDTLPSGFSFISADDGASPGDPNAFQCTNTGNVVDCISALIDGGGATRTIKVKAFSAAQPGLYTNQAVVDPNNAIPEGNETNNTAQAQTRVRVGAGYVDLTVKKCDTPLSATCKADPQPTVDVDNPTSSSDITYRIEARNNGTDPAFDVTVRDVLPAGVTFLSALDTTPSPNGAFGCTYASGVVTCSGGTLDGSSNLIDSPDVPDVRTITIRVKAPNANGSITNQVSIDPSNTIAESNETNNADTETTGVESFVNLTLDKSGPSTAQQNNEEDYKITIQNSATSGTFRPVEDVHVVDTLPVGLIPLTWSAEGNFTCQIFENPVNYVDCVGDLPNDTPVHITVHVFVTQDGGTVDNEACIDPDNAFVESEEGDNCDTKTTTIKKFAPNLSVQKHASTGTVTPGQTFTYTVSLSNIGDATALGPTTLFDSLPSEVTLVGTPIATNGFTCSGDPLITCTKATGMAPGDSTSISIEVKVNDGVTTPFDNTAFVVAALTDTTAAPCPPDPSARCEVAETQTDNNTATVTTNVGGSSVDLVLTGLTDSPDPANVGQNVEYTFTVTNGGTGSSGPFDIAATMTPTTGLNFVGATASQGFGCSGLVTDTVTCSGTLPAGQSTAVKIVFQVTADTPTLHTLDVEADSGHAVLESSEANNTASETTTVTSALCTGCIDLVMGGILVTPSPIVGDGTSVSYIVTASNTGDQPTTNLAPDAAEVRVYLPDGVDVDTGSATATSGFSCTDGVLLGVEYVDCTGDLNGGQGVTVTFTATSDATEVTGDGSIATTAWIDPFNAFPEGSGSTDEFTNSNNSVTVLTYFDVP